MRKVGGNRITPQTIATALNSELREQLTPELVSKVQQALNSPMGVPKYAVAGLGMDVIDKLTTLSTKDIGKVSLDRLVMATVFVTFVYAGIKAYKAYMAINRPIAEAYKAKEISEATLIQEANAYKASSIVSLVMKHCPLDVSSMFVEERVESINKLVAMARNNPEDFVKPLSARTQLEAIRLLLENITPKEQVEKNNVTVNIDNSSKQATIIESAKDSLSLVTDSQILALKKGNTSLQDLGELKVVIPSTSDNSEDSEVSNEINS